MPTTALETLNTNRRVTQQPGTACRGGISGPLRLTPLVACMIVSDEAARHAPKPSPTHYHTMTDVHALRELTYIFR